MVSWCAAQWLERWSVIGERSLARGRPAADVSDG